MNGPIDFIVVEYKHQKFDGSALEALTEAIEQKIIRLIALSVISKDTDGKITTLDIADLGDEVLMDFSQRYPRDDTAIDQEDLDEVGELLKDDTAGALLIIEHLWAVPLKEAIMKTGGTLVADGRIHPAAAETLDQGKVTT